MQQDNNPRERELYAHSACPFSTVNVARVAFQQGREDALRFYKSRFHLDEKAHKLKTRAFSSANVFYSEYTLAR